MPTPAQALLARNRLVQGRREGQTPAPSITPAFDEYANHYLDCLEATEAKSKLTVARERCALKHCIAHFGCTRIGTITAANIEAYILKRKQQGVNSRTVNVQISALRGMFRYAKRQGVLTHELPTERIQQLPYQYPKRTLVSAEAIDALCAEATRTETDPAVQLIAQIQKDYRRADGTVDWTKAWEEHPEWRVQLGADTENGRQALYSRSGYLESNPEAALPQPVHPQGQMLCDWIRLMQYSGARRTAALRARWDHVDWNRQQLHLFTKRSKEVVVEFNPKLEALLRDLYRRRLPQGPGGQFSPFLFPSPRPGDLGCLHSFQKTLVAVRTAAQVPTLRPHDLRHYFISICVMEGFDYMTIAEWVGHSDGGILIGKVYGHLAPGHRQALARRLTFEGARGAAPAAAPARDASELSVEELLKLAQEKLARPPAAP